VVVYKDQIQPKQAKQYATQPQHPSSQESEAVISNEEQSSPEIPLEEEATDDVEQAHS
jgi:hypothetical protein